MTSTLERATKFLDYRLTGSEGVIAISIMAEFADTLIAERDAEIERLRDALQRILAPSPSAFQDMTVKHLRGIAHNALAETK